MTRFLFVLDLFGATNEELLGASVWRLHCRAMDTLKPRKAGEQWANWGPKVEKKRGRASVCLGGAFICIMPAACQSRGGIGGGLSMRAEGQEERKGRLGGRESGQCNQERNDDVSMGTKRKESNCELLASVCEWPLFREGTKQTVCERWTRREQADRKQRDSFAWPPARECGSLALWQVGRARPSHQTNKIMDYGSSEGLFNQAEGFRLQTSTGTCFETWFDTETGAHLHLFVILIGPSWRANSSWPKSLRVYIYI